MEINRKRGREENGDWAQASELPEGDIKLEELRGLMEHTRKEMFTKGLVDPSQGLIGGASSAPGSSPSPRRPRGMSVAARAAATRLNPCEGKDGLDLANV